MLFYSVIILLWYDSSSFSQATFFYSYRHPFHPTQNFSCDYQVWRQLYFTGGKFFIHILSLSIDGVTVFFVPVRHLQKSQN